MLLIKQPEVTHFGALRLEPTLMVIIHACLEAMVSSIHLHNLPAEVFHIANHVVNQELSPDLTTTETRHKPHGTLAALRTRMNMIFLSIP